MKSVRFSDEKLRTLVAGETVIVVELKKKGDFVSDWSVEDSMSHNIHVVGKNKKVRFRETQVFRAYNEKGGIFSFCRTCHEFPKIDEGYVYDCCHIKNYKFGKRKITGEYSTTQNIKMLTAKQTVKQCLEPLLAVLEKIEEKKDYFELCSAFEGNDGHHEKEKFIICKKCEGDGGSHLGAVWLKSFRMVKK